MNNEGKIKTFIFLFLIGATGNSLFKILSSKYLIMNAYVYIHMLMCIYKNEMNGINKQKNRNKITKSEKKSMKLRIGDQ